MSEKLIITILLGVAIIASATIYSGSYIVNKNRDRQFEVQQRAISEDKMKSCILRARTDYDNAWTQACLSLGRELGCLLPSKMGQGLDASFKTNQNSCVEMYDKN